jgi:phosphate transport system ATP-binding protein
VSRARDTFVTNAAHTRSVATTNEHPAPREPASSRRFAVERRSTPTLEAPTILELDKLEVRYGSHRAVRDVSLAIPKNHITAFIGPSGCGKTTVLRCLNRMNDLVPGARVGGTVRYHGVDLYGRDISPAEVRRRIGMVFQKPNPFPKSIFENIAFGLRITGMTDRLHERVEQALRSAALWDEVKDRLHASALGMSGGQQQRLCIARTIAIAPEVVLMDEPCSALDPIATARIEELIRTLADDFTIVIVTHNMQQAARVSDLTAFFTTEVNPAGDHRTGVLVEHGPTGKLFSSPSDQRTENYITGRFG